MKGGGELVRITRVMKTISFDYANFPRRSYVRIRVSNHSIRIKKADGKVRSTELSSERNEKRKNRVTNTSNNLVGRQEEYVANDIKIFIGQPINQD